MTDGDRETRQLRLGFIGAGAAVEKLHWLALKWMSERFRTVAFANRTRAMGERFSQYSGVAMDGYRSHVIRLGHHVTGKASKCERLPWMSPDHVR
ncbi:MAG TPA: hypothetical protein VLA19_17595 [Herpetosiphonaceae bacterium]|nr:hypothetical protein [Herpetosiphonaceae bacterium]